jgi:hypothetical protein
LNSVHEVVVRNRLEQLRKRQRDEALQAQEELLAGVAKAASRTHESDTPLPESQPIEPEVAEIEEPIEAYDRSMSPMLIDITKLSVEERQIDILTASEDLLQLVCAPIVASRIDFRLLASSISAGVR